MAVGLPQVCILLVLVITLVLLGYGFYDVLKGQKTSEDDPAQTISRQIRGIGLIILGHIVFVVGMAICLGGMKRSCDMDKNCDNFLKDFLSY